MRNVESAVRHARKARGWSQAHLAQASGLSSRTILRIENGVSCSGESLMALAAALELDLIPPADAKSGRRIVVHVPDAIGPSWLKVVFAPHGYGNDVSIKLVAVVLAFTFAAGLDDHVGSRFGSFMGDMWAQGWAVLIFLYSILFTVWFLAAMVDDWVNRQVPA